MDKITLITDLGKIGIPYLDYEISEVIEDTYNVKKSHEILIFVDEK